MRLSPNLIARAAPTALRGFEDWLCAKVLRQSFGTSIERSTCQPRFGERRHTAT